MLLPSRTANVQNPGAGDELKYSIFALESVKTVKNKKSLAMKAIPIEETSICPREIPSP